MEPLLITSAATIFIQTSCCHSRVLQSPFYRFPGSFVYSSVNPNHDLPMTIRCTQNKSVPSSQPPKLCSTNLSSIIPPSLVMLRSRWPSCCHGETSTSTSLPISPCFGNHWELYFCYYSCLEHSPPFGPWHLSRYSGFGPAIFPA